MSKQQQIQLAQSLPARLIRFFERYPPPALFPRPAAITPATTETASTILPADSNASLIESPSPVETSLNQSTSTTPASTDLPYPNPFLPRKNYVTGRWYGPVYGLRKQADLVKLAKTHGVLDLLPWTIKKPGEKEKRRLERGLAVKGTGAGEKVKGHKWERTLKGRLETRRQAMLEMPALIQEWKQVSELEAIDVEWHTDNCIERAWSWVEEVAVGQSQKVTAAYKKEIGWCWVYALCMLYVYEVERHSIYKTRRESGRLGTIRPFHFNRPITFEFERIFLCDQTYDRSEMLSSKSAIVAGYRVSV